MIKTLRKIWKSDWGKAALLGVGMVGYGALSRALPAYLPAYSKGLIDRTLTPTGTGFLADIQGQAASLIRSPFAIGEVLGGKGYDYLIGRDSVGYGDFKKELQSAIAPVREAFGIVKDLDKEISGSPKDGGGFGGGQREKIKHKQAIMPIGPAGTVALAQARGSRTFDPNRTAHQLLAKAYSDRYYKDIDQQARGVQRYGPNISVKESGTLAISRPSYRYTA